MTTGRRCRSTGGDSVQRSPATGASRSTRRVMRSSSPASASSAVAAAAECQRALADGPIRVRMGLHTGEPRLTEEGYIGLEVHKGARIAAVGHGLEDLVAQVLEPVPA